QQRSRRTAQSRSRRDKDEPSWENSTTGAPFSRYHAVRGASCFAGAPANSLARSAYAPFEHTHDCLRCLGGQGVSATGVSGGLPAPQAKRVSTTSWSLFSRGATAAEPRWGNRTT